MHSCVRLFVDMTPILHLYLHPCILRSDNKTPSIRSWSLFLHLCSHSGLMFCFSLLVCLFVFSCFYSWNIEKRMMWLKQTSCIFANLLRKSPQKHINKSRWAIQRTHGGELDGPSQGHDRSAYCQVSCQYIRKLSQDQWSLPS